MLLAGCDEPHVQQLWLYHSRPLRSKYKTSLVHNPETKEQDLKTNLLALAQYKRQCADTIVERLVAELQTSFGDGAAKARGLTLFVSVIGLYANMYIAKDFSDPKRKTQSEERVSRHL